MIPPLKLTLKKMVTARNPVKPFWGSNIREEIPVVFNLTPFLEKIRVEIPIKLLKIIHIEAF